jgi:acyl-CoA thioesterase
VNPPATRFDRDTELEHLGPGRYRGRIDTGWWIVAGPNGGYVAAILLRGMMREVNDAARSPRSLTIHYLRPPAEGAVDLLVTVERAGRSVTTVTARLLQDEKLMALAIGAFGPSRQSYDFQDPSPPVMPPPEACPRVRDKYPGTVELQKRYDARVGLGDDLYSGSERALIGGYIRLEEPRLPDALIVAAFTDAFIPPVFARTTSRSQFGPVPTIDLTIHFRTSLPLASATPQDYCAVAFRSTVAREGFIEEEGEVWSPDGVLLAQSRQLALLT